MKKMTNKIKSNGKRDPIDISVLRDGKIKSVTAGKTGTFNVFYDKKKNSSKGKLVVVRSTDREAVKEATKRLGKPTTTAKLRNGIVELGNMHVMRCFINQAATRRT